MEGVCHAETETEHLDRWWQIPAPPKSAGPEGRAAQRELPIFSTRSFVGWMKAYANTEDVFLCNRRPKWREIMLAENAF
jgi:hypothetical protein